MKRIMILTALLLVFVTTLYADFAVDSTRSMSSDHFIAIRDDFIITGSPERHYWEEFIDRTPFKDDSLVIDGMKGYNLFNSHLYAKEALWGAVVIET